MNPHRGIELRLGEPRLHPDGDAGDNFRRVRAYYVRADDALGGGVDDEFHQGAFVTARERVPQRLEGRLVDVDFAEFFHCLGLRQSDGTYRWLAEHGAWHIV